jgi:copper(I)-binding protein
MSNRIVSRFPAWTRRLIPALLIVLAFGLPDSARSAGNHAVKFGDLEITAAWARAMLPGQPAGGGYFSVTNTGAEADRLVAASSPTSGKVEIHEMKVENDVMTMRPVEGGLEIAPGATVELKPGGFHLMFMQVAEPFQEGATVPVTLEFEKAGMVDLDFPVKLDAGGDHSTHGG